MIGAGAEITKLKCWSWSQEGSGSTALDAFHAINKDCFLANDHETLKDELFFVKTVEGAKVSALPETDSLSLMKTLSTRAFG